MKKLILLAMIFCFVTPAFAADPGIPWADNKFKLGDSTHRWNDGYVEDFTIADDLTLGGDVAISGGITGDGSSVAVGMKDFVARPEVAAYSFTAADTGKIFTNDGYAAEIIFYLPEATTANTGLEYTVACSNPDGLSVTVRPQETDIIRSVTGGEQLTAGDGMGTLVIGASASYKSYSSAGWIITNCKKDADWDKWTWK